MKQGIVIAAMKNMSMQWRLATAIGINTLVLVTNKAIRE